MLKDNLRIRKRARLCGKLKLLSSELSLRADHYAVCVSAICFKAVLEANLHLSNLSKYFTFKNFFNLDNLENSCIQKGNCKI